jgi:hypothetical protein
MLRQKIVRPLRFPAPENDNRTPAGLLKKTAESDLFPSHQRTAPRARYIHDEHKAEWLIAGKLDD